MFLHRELLVAKICFSETFSSVKGEVFALSVELATEVPGTFTRSPPALPSEQSRCVHKISLGMWWWWDRPQTGGNATCVFHQMVKEEQEQKGETSMKKTHFLRAGLITRKWLHVGADSPVQKVLVLRLVPVRLPWGRWALGARAAHQPGQPRPPAPQQSFLLPRSAGQRWVLLWNLLGSKDNNVYCLIQWCPFWHCLT